VTDLSHLGPEARKAWLEARLAPLEKIPGNTEKKRKNLIQAVANQLRKERASGLIRKPYIQGVSDG